MTKYENLDDIVFALEQYDQLLTEIPYNTDLLEGKIEILRGLEEVILVGGKEINPVLELNRCYNHILNTAAHDSPVWDRTAKRKIDLCIDAGKKNWLIAAIMKYKINNFACTLIYKRIIDDRCSWPEKEQLVDWLLEFSPDCPPGMTYKALAISKKNLNAGLEFCDKYIQKRGETFLPWHTKAHILNAAGNYGEAIAYYNEARKRLADVKVPSWSFEFVESTWASIIPATISCLLAAGKHKDALELAQTPIQKANIHYVLKEYANAKKILLPFIEADKTAAMLLGHSDYAMENFDGATAAYKAWTALEPKNADAWYWLGKSNIMAGPTLNALEIALQCFKRSKSLGNANLTEYMGDIELRIRVLKNASPLRKL